jgi:hypothetical protein
MTNPFTGLPVASNLNGSPGPCETAPDCVSPANDCASLCTIALPVSLALAAFTVSRQIGAKFENVWLILTYTFNATC